MALYQYKEFVPEVGNDCYVADSAEVIGNVRIGDRCYVGPGAVIRGDYGRVVIGDGVAVEEHVVIHARPGETTTIGNNVTLGHACVIHTPKMIGDYSVIGMGAVVSDFAVLGKWVAVGEGAVVRNGQEISAGKIAVGVPAKIIGDVSEDYKAKWTEYKKIYADLAKNYASDLKPL